MRIRPHDLAILGFMLTMTLIAGNEILHRIVEDDTPQISPAIVTEPTPRTVVITPVPSTPAPTTTTTVAPTTTVTAHDAMQADLAVWDALDALPADTKCVEWMELAMQAGWPADPQVLHTLGKVLWKESRCQPLVYGGPGTHNWDVGLTQINQIHRPWVEELFGMPYEEAMSDPWRNLHFAFRLWESRELEGKCGWKPWSLPC